LDVKTAEYVSKMLGDSTVIVPRTSRTESDAPLSLGSTTYSKTDHRRPLLTPDELMCIGQNEVIVRTGNRFPMKLLKFYYDGQPVSGIAQKLGSSKALDLTPSTASVG